MAEQIAQHDKLKKIAADIEKAGFTHCVLLGMGGSSLCVEVFAKTYGHEPGRPQMHVLDSTDPAQIRTIEKNIDIAKTIFIVASKSGSTLEPNIFKQFFYDRVTKRWAPPKPESGSSPPPIRARTCRKWPRTDGFRNIFYGVPSIGGRYSALSNFGMVPAAIQGVGIAKFLERAEEMVMGCGAAVAADQESRRDSRRDSGHRAKNGPR